jgi:hypothetical protein
MPIPWGRITALVSGVCLFATRSACATWPQASTKLQLDHQVAPPGPGKRRSEDLWSREEDHRPVSRLLPLGHDRRREQAIPRHSGHRRCLRCPPRADFLRGPDRPVRPDRGMGQAGQGLAAACRPRRPGSSSSRSDRTLSSSPCAAPHHRTVPAGHRAEGRPGTPARRSRGAARSRTARRGRGTPRPVPPELTWPQHGVRFTSWGGDQGLLEVRHVLIGCSVVPAAAGLQDVEQAGPGRYDVQLQV